MAGLNFLHVQTVKLCNVHFGQSTNKNVAVLRAAGRPLVVQGCPTTLALSQVTWRGPTNQVKDPVERTRGKTLKMDREKLDTSVLEQTDLIHSVVLFLLSVGCQFVVLLPFLLKTTTV